MPKPWEDAFDRDDPMKPWNDPIHRDDPFAPWNRVVDDERDYERYCEEKRIPEYRR